MISNLLFTSAVANTMRENIQAELTGQRAARVAGEAKTEIDLMRGDLARLFLLCEAMWSILKDKHGYTEEDLVTRMQEIDMRDGKLDNRRGPSPQPDCPKCGRKIMGRHPICLFCGEQVPRDVFEP